MVGTIPTPISDKGRCAVPGVQCLTCGSNIWLDAETYVDYNGPLKCSACNGSQTVIISGGTLTSASLQAGVYDTILDVLVWKIPQDILYDLGEAAVDLANLSIRSCVVMCRRVVHTVLLEHDIKDNLSLHDMIEEARGKGILNEQQTRQAQAIRYLGVTGAHPKDEELRSVDLLDAQMTLAMTKRLLQTIYPKKPEQPPPTSQP